MNIHQLEKKNKELHQTLIDLEHDHHHLSIELILLLRSGI